MISENIKKIRKDHGWTLKELAAQIGVHFSSLSRWETGVQEPRAKYRRRIATIAGIPEIDLWK